MIILWSDIDTAEADKRGTAPLATTTDTAFYDAALASPSLGSVAAASAKASRRQLSISPRKGGLQTVRQLYRLSSLQSMQPSLRLKPPGRSELANSLPATLPAPRMRSSFVEYTVGACSRWRACAHSELIDPATSARAKALLQLARACCT